MLFISRNFTAQRAFLLFSIVLFSFLLTACGGGDVAGPSEEKIRLDIQDKMDMAYNGLVAVDSLRIKKREVLSEDRVNLNLTIKLAVDEAQVDKAIEAYWERQRIVRSFRNPPNKAQLMMIDGEEGIIDVQYRQQSESIWNMLTITARERAAQSDSRR